MNNNFSYIRYNLFRYISITMFAHNSINNVKQKTLCMHYFPIKRKKHFGQADTSAKLSL